MTTKKTTTPTKANHRSQALIIFCYAIVPVFFTLFYFLMVKTYEDILMTYSQADSSVGQIMDFTYNYIPRIGEFYQRIAIHFMTTGISFGLDLLFRLLTVTMSTGLVYLLTFFVLGHRPRLEKRDALVFVAMFIVLLVSEVGEAFTYRFSFVHNYVLAMLVTVAFLLPYRLHTSSRHPLAYLGMLALGFLFGISTEVAPIAILIIFAFLAIFNKIRQKLTLKAFWQKYKLQIVGVLGTLLGLLFFYLGAGLGVRTNGTYGEIYEYVRLSDFFVDPITTGYNLVKHFWYNLRYLTFAILLMLTIIGFEFVRLKKKQSSREHFVLHLCTFAFSGLFVAASSLIAVHDDLYFRFMFPIYLAVFASLFIFLLDHLLAPSIASPRFIHGLTVACAIIAAIMTVDATVSMASYHHRVADIATNTVTYDPERELIFDEATLPEPASMIPSIIFRFHQLSPFGW